MLKEFKKLIENSSSIVFFGGAGVSTESNIPDFRSEQGIYNIRNKYSRTAEEMLSHSFFVNNPCEFYDFYKSFMIYREALPNTAHIKLAELEKEGRLKAVITQNIDGLHQMAGSEKVIELHGSVHRNYCMKCNRFFDLDYILGSAETIPYCDNCRGIIKPDVVLYEEPLDMKVINEAVDYISNCDVLIVAGTSLSVYPAAGLIDYYRSDKLVVINKRPTSRDKNAAFLFNENICDVLKDI